MDVQVEILLAVYNGSAYLNALLGSILTQTHSNWQILARDDGSSDETVAILERFCRNHPGRMRIVVDNFGNLRPCRSFECLMKESSAQYIMFCDQDDIWLPKKIEVSLSAMIASESAKTQECPILVCTDMIVVDGNLKELSRSFWELQSVNVKAVDNWYFLCFQNPAAGCTTMLNRAAVRLTLPIGSNAIMHDWWSALVCGRLGRVVCVPVATVLYRQHSHNSVGAGKKGVITFDFFHYCVGIFLRPKKAFASWKHHALRISQAKSVARTLNVDYSTAKYFFEIFKSKYWYSIISRFVPKYHNYMWSKYFCQPE